MKIEYRYREKDVENAIKNFPKEFLGEELEFIAQQLPLFNLIPDLVFKDINGKIVIVEIQIGRLDLNHIYKTLGYKDLYEIKYSQEKIRIIVVICGAIGPTEEIILKKRKIDYIVFSGKEFIQKAKQLGIRLHRVTPQLSVHDLLDRIKKEKVNNNLGLDALAFYIDRYEPNSRYLYDYSRNLREVKKYPYRYHLKMDDVNLRFKVPWEIILSPEILMTTSDQVWRISTILAFATKYAGFEPENETIILGYRNAYDDFGFEQHLENRKLLFEALCKAYDTFVADWDFNLLKKDLEYLKSLKIYCGKYPNFSPKTIFKSFNIEKGLGVLEGNWERQLETIAQYHPNDVKYVKERHERMYAKPFWLLNFELFDWELAELILFMFQMLREHYQQKKIDMQLHRWDNRFLILPKKIENLSRSTLRLTSHYFIHYDN